MISVSLRRTGIAALLVMAPAVAQAAVVEFLGRDPGLGETTPLTATPNADQARSDFMARAERGQIESFESFADGTFAWTQQADGSWAPGRELPFTAGSFGSGAPGLTGTLTAATGTVVDPAAATNGFGRYATHGDKFFHSGAATVSLEFDRGITAVGFDGVDVGDFEGQLTVDVFNGNALVFSDAIDHETNGAGGDVLFWGLVSENIFTRLVLGNSGGDADVFAVDRLLAGGPIVTPVPAALPLLASGVAGLAWLRRRRARTA